MTDVMEGYSPDTPLDVAIIGGGASGTYAAYRLQVEGRADNIAAGDLTNGRTDTTLRSCLFELEDRIGGRLWSYPLRDSDGLIAEIGGQGFSELQCNVFGLCEHLGLERVPCDAFNRSTLQYFRRHRFRFEDYFHEDRYVGWESDGRPGGALGDPHHAPAKIPFFVRSDERMDPGSLIYKEVKERIDNVDPAYSHVIELLTALQFVRETGRDDAISCDSQKWLEGLQDRGDTDAFSEDVNALYRRFKALSTAEDDTGRILTSSLPDYSQTDELDLKSQIFREIAELSRSLQQAHVSLGDPEQKFPTREIGFWNWLAQNISNEAYQLLLYSSFANSAVRNYNFYDEVINFLLVNLSFHQETPFWSLAKGYDALAKSLACRFEQAGGKICNGKQLRKIDADGRLVVLTLTDPKTSEEFVCYAHHAILALPKFALSRLEIGDRLSTHAQFETFQHDLNSVTAIPASKLFLVYNAPWWKPFLDDNSAGGYSTTDLPLRACYYIGANKKRALLLASLADSVYHQFWSGYLEMARSGHHTGRSSDPDRERLGVSEPMVAEVQRQLKALHYDEDAPGPLPEPDDHLYFSWMREPYGGGWHTWNPFVDSPEVMKRIRKPFGTNGANNVNLYVCGEAYSATQGWVEGALNSAEMMLQKHFHLARADWINPYYNLGH